MTPVPGSAFKVAAIQFEPEFGAVDRNLAAMEAHIRAAHAQGVRLMVLPELADSDRSVPRRIPLLLLLLDLHRHVHLEHQARHLLGERLVLDGHLQSTRLRRSGGGAAAGWTPQTLRLRPPCS